MPGIPENPTVTGIRAIPAFRLGIVLALAMAWTAAATAGESAPPSAYARLMRVFEDTRHRLPGSEGHRRALEATETELRSAGLDPQRQYFPTVVPETLECVLTVDGRTIPGVLPLGPSAFATIATGPDPIAGPLHYVGDARPEDFHGIPDGRPWIAVVEFGSPNMARAFRNGARAVVFVDDDRATQWQAAEHFTWMPFAPPRAWVSRETARAEGLLEAAGVAATLKINVAWKDVEAVNLWVDLPATLPAPTPATGVGSRMPELLVLSASLDTFGAVPSFCPERRLAANAALLAETLAELAKTPRERSVLGVFFGSQYSAEEAGRYFYYAMAKAAPDRDPLPLRVEWCRGEREQLQAQDRLLADADAFFAPGRRSALPGPERPAYDAAAKRLRAMLDAWVNNANFDLRRLKLARNELLRIAEPDEAQRRALEENAAEDERITAQKKAWNDLKRQVTKTANIEAGRVAGRPTADGERDNVWHFRRVAEAVRAELALRRDELDAELRVLDSCQRLSRHFAGKSVVGHFGFDFARADRPWLFNPVGDAELVYPAAPVGQFVRHLGALRKICLRRPELATGTHGPLPESLTGAYEPWALATPAPPSGFAQAAQAMRVAGYSVLSAGDALDHDRLPRRAAVDLAPLVPATARFFGELARAPELSLAADLPRSTFDAAWVYTRNGGAPTGQRFVNYAKGSSEIEGPAAGALATLQTTAPHKPLVGHTRFALGRVNREGHVFMPNLQEYWQESWNTARRAAAGFDAYGRVERLSDIADPSRLFHARGGGFWRPFNPAAYNRVDAGQYLDARTNAAFKYSRAWTDTGLGVFYGDRDAPFKFIGAGLVLVDAAETPPGRKTAAAPGLASAPEALASLDAVRQGMSDYLFIAAERLAGLRAANINDDSVESLFADAELRAERAADARRADAAARASAEEAFGLAAGLRAYTPLREAANDMVRAVLVLMILSIPFAFAMERLLCGFASIYRQIGGFTAFFLATFALLYFTHPAFALASAPVVVFLAFVIILMSGLVILIVMGRFKQEIRKMQGLVSKAHSAAKESSTALASVMIGISGMRNRPLKTFLTAATVVLLTFTIMAFSSFTSVRGVTDAYLGEGSGPDRVELHLPTFLALPDELVAAVETLYADEYEVVRRAAVFNDPFRQTGSRAGDFLLWNPATTSVVKLSGMLGVSPGELARHEGRAFADLAPGLASRAEPADDAPPPLWLSRRVAEQLRLAEGDGVMLRGRTFRYAGPFGTEALQGLNLDGSRLVPPDFTATTQANNLDKTGNAEAALANLDASGFVWCETDAMAVTDLRGAASVPGAVNFLALYPRPGKEPDLGATATEIAGVMQGPVYAQSAKGALGARRYFFTSELRGAGLSDIAVPLVLGGLIIFSSLLGSIVDREKEIFTYSALGLAPPDVAALFFAESTVYAVVGGMGGYLLSQGAAAALAVMADWGWLSPPRMNFSSLSSIYTILLVMATVLLSTVYPALKAGRSANPGVARRWRMPAPDGDRLRFVFPFTVGAADLAGVLSFVREHFLNHADTGLGSFAARDVSLFRHDRPRDAETLGIRSTVALAPFDLGVSQRFRLHSQASDIAGIEEIVVDIERVSGSPRLWLRSNRAFIDDLRNQFLLWRSMPMETMDHYRRQTARALAGDGPDGRDAEGVV